MTRQTKELSMMLTFVFGVILLGAGLGYSTCQISHHHHSCSDGSTRCMTNGSY